MKQLWVLQGRIRATDKEWFDLHERRRRRDLPKVNMRIAKMIGGEYRIVLQNREG